MTYIESAADHDMTAFLAGLSVRKVLQDRTANYSRVERKRERFYVAKSKAELAEIRESEIYIALRMAREMTQQKEEANG